MSEESKAIVRRQIDELWSQGKLEVVDDIYAPDFVDRSPGLPPGIAAGREGVKQFVSMFRSAFPDIEGGTDELIAEGDKVVVRWSAQATHQGEFMGVPASGKRVSFSGTSTYRIAGGKIAEEWTHADILGLMTQIGAIPEMATA